MRQTAKLFAIGSSQAVCLPRACWFAESEVFIRRDPLTGDVVLSRKPADWQGFLDAVAQTPDADDFLNERIQTCAQQASFDGWTECALARRSARQASVPRFSPCLAQSPNHCEKR